MSTKFKVGDKVYTIQNTSIRTTFISGGILTQVNKCASDMGICSIEFNNSGGVCGVDVITDDLEEIINYIRVKYADL